MDPRFLKKTALCICSFIALCASACWYSSAFYNNYIYAINTKGVHVSNIVKTDNSITYTCVNNTVVDLPLTITMKLTSEEPISINTIESDVVVQLPTNAVTAELQYRVIDPNNPDNADWTTVTSYQIESGKIPESYPPAPFLGRNNINPMNIAKGDKLMIRLYVKMAQWESGSPESPCTANNVYLQDTVTYTVSKTGNQISINPSNVNMGGMWLPQYVMTLEWSGNRRPIQ